MKCSLLTLSHYIDGEQTPERRGEVDAHLVACGRCSAGVRTLREERDRIGHLARVRVDPASAESMFQQIGIGSIGVAEKIMKRIEPDRPSAPAGPPWSVPSGGSALPWAPLRPVSRPPESSSVERQVELPLEAAVAETAPAEIGRRDLAEEADAAVGEPGGGAPPPQAWGPTPAGARVDDSPPAPVDHRAEVLVGGPADAQADEALTRDHPGHPPQRPAAAAPAAAMRWYAAIRDAVTVRLALARAASPQAEPLVDIMDGPLRPAVTTGPAPAPPVPADPASRAAAGHSRPFDDLLPELAGASPEVLSQSFVEPGEASATTGGSPLDPVPAVLPAAGAAEERFDAFAASTYTPPAAAASGAPRATRRPPGRHTRALNRRPPLAERVGGAVTSLAPAMQAAARRIKLSRGHLPPRLSRERGTVLAVSGIVLLFVLALVVGRQAPSRPAQAHPTPAAPTTQNPAGRSGAPTAATSPSPPAAPTPSAPAAALPAPQSLGSGATGFTVAGIRYGQHPDALRVVFDLSSPTGSGSPATDIRYAAPGVLVVTLHGVDSGAQPPTPPAGSVITAVQLVKSSSGTTQYRLTLSRTATFSSSYLGSPVRLVLDIH